MGDRAVTADVQPAAAAAKTGEQKNLLEESGFLNGMRKLRDTTTDVVRSGVEKGKEVINDPNTRRVTGEIVDAGKKVINSPTTQRITGEVIQEGKQIGREKVGQVNRVIDSGKRGDVEGVVRNAAPLARDVILGPEALALKIAKDKAFDVLINNAPPERRRELRMAREAFDKTQQITNPNVSRMIEDQLKRQATETAVEAARNPNVRREAIETGKTAVEKTGNFFRGLGEKMHIVPKRDEPAPQERQRK